MGNNAEVLGKEFEKIRVAYNPSNSSNFTIWFNYLLISLNI